jgi:hypothetical protein
MKKFKRDAQNRIVPTFEVTPELIAEALARPSDFGWSGRPEMFKTWSLGPALQNRDSGLLDQSNAAALIEFLLSDPSLVGEYKVVRSAHWAVGWVEQLSFHAIEKPKKGQKPVPTRIFAIIAEWFDYLKTDYPVADDEDYSQRESEATLEHIEQAWIEEFRDTDGLPEDWQKIAFTWFWEEAPEEIESQDDKGGYPSSESIKALAKAKGWTPKEGK